MLTAPESDRPDLRAEQAETVARYKAALVALPAEQRDVFLLYEESGLSLEEIAVITAVGAETAKSRLRYAVAKLRHAMTPTGGFPAGDSLAGRSVAGRSVAPAALPVAPTPMVVMPAAPVVADAIQEGGI
jgi:hypothetical protein